MAEQPMAQEQVVVALIDGLVRELEELDRQGFDWKRDDVQAPIAALGVLLEKILADEMVLDDDIADSDLSDTDKYKVQAARDAEREEAEGRGIPMQRPSYLDNHE